MGFFMANTLTISKQFADVKLDNLRRAGLKNRKL
jgi:hypothetical protein